MRSAGKFVLLWLAYSAAIALLPHSASAQSLQQQVECAAQAKKAFQEYNSSVSYWNNYESHYNAKLNRCLIVLYRQSAKDVATHLADAFGFHVFATYLSHGERTPLVCKIEKSFGKMDYCNSKGEFDAFVAKYMND